MTDESKIAMAQTATDGASDNRNGQAMLDLQKATKVGGNKTFNDAYATLVSDVGNKTSTLKTSSTTQTNVVTQLSNQQQSISGLTSMKSTATCNVISNIIWLTPRFCRPQARCLMRCWKFAK